MIKAWIWQISSTLILISVLRFLKISWHVLKKGKLKHAALKKKITVMAAEYNLVYIKQIKFTQPEANY